MSTLRGRSIPPDELAKLPDVNEWFRKNDFQLRTNHWRLRDLLQSAGEMIPVEFDGQFKGSDLEGMLPPFRARRLQNDLSDEWKRMAK